MVIGFTLLSCYNGMVDSLGRVQLTVVHAGIELATLVLSALCSNQLN